MRSKLLTSAAAFGLAVGVSSFAVPAFAQSGTYQSAPNGMNSGQANPAPGAPIQSVPNSLNSGHAMPAPAQSVQSVPNGMNSGQANPAPSPAASVATPSAPMTSTAETMPPMRRHRHMAAIRTDGPRQWANASEPRSARASNIDQVDTHSEIAPALPMPDVGPNADARQYLAAARTALQNGQTGMAQEALERAETRILDRSTAPDNANTPDNGPRIKDITDARDALARGDRDGAIQAISRVNDMANGASGAPAQPSPAQPM